MRGQPNRRGERQRSVGSGCGPDPCRPLRSGADGRRLGQGGDTTQRRGHRACCAPPPAWSTRCAATACRRATRWPPRGSPGSWPPSAPRTSFRCAIPIALTGVEVELRLGEAEVGITATVRTTDRTGVEMEALTAVAVAGADAARHGEGRRPGRGAGRACGWSARTAARPAPGYARRTARDRPPGSGDHRLQPRSGRGLPGPRRADHRRVAAGARLRLRRPGRRARTASRSPTRCAPRSPTGWTS